MNNELIEYYINECYNLGSTDSYWVGVNKYNGQEVVLTKMSMLMRKIFPRMNAEDVCRDWFNERTKTVTDKINNHLAKYKIVGGADRIFHWTVRNNFGKEVGADEICKELIELTPHHISNKLVSSFYDDWFEEEKRKATEKLMGC